LSHRCGQFIAYVSGGLSLEGMSQNFSKIRPVSKILEGPFFYRRAFDWRRMKKNQRANSRPTATPGAAIRLWSDQ